MKLSFVSLLCAALLLPHVVVSAGAANTVTATPTEWKGQTVQMDGQIVKIEGYNIKDNNYFKLRDLGKLLDFEVSFDAASNTVTIGDLSTSYTMLPDEAPIRTWDDGLGLVSYIGTGVSGQTQQQAKLTTQRFTANGKPVSLTAYQIAGNNYLMLRDVAALTGFDVDYIPDGRVVRISVEEQADKPQEKPTPDHSSDENDSASAAVNDATLQEYAQEVIRLTNLERAKAGLSALKVNDKLMQAAAIRAGELTEKFEHIRPNGDEVYSVYGEVGFDLGTKLAGEIAAYGQNSPQKVTDAWMQSARHRDWVLSSECVETGVGVVESSDGLLYWIQVFAGA